MIRKIETNSTQEAMDFAGHNFTVEKRDLVTVDGIRIPDKAAVVNADANEYLGTVGTGWEPVQPEVLYDMANHLMENTNGTINGVISMLNNAVIGISFNIANREYVAGDVTELNFLMLTSFNGLYGINGNATSNRLDCQANQSNKVYNLRHTRFVHNRINVVKNMLKYYENEIKRFDAKMFHLAGKRMNDEQAISWFRSLFPNPTSKRSETMLDNQVGVFVNCLLNGRGTDIQGVKGTAYGAFQALTEYVNHERATRICNGRDSEEVRFQSVHFGSGSRLTLKGMDKLIEGDSFILESDFLV